VHLSWEVEFVLPEKPGRDTWRKIAITLIDPEKGEGKAQSCVNACFRQLSSVSASAV
jgi:hypothetical protein